MHPVTNEEVATFWRDGVVCLRGVVPLDWIELVARSMQEWQKPHHASVADGNVLDHPDCPVVWHRAAGATAATPVGA